MAENNTSWMREVNDILYPHRFRDGDIFIRFMATQYPKPTVSIAVYDGGEKIAERPIRRLEEFIEDLKDALDIIKEVRRKQPRTRTRPSTRRRRRSEEGEEQNEGQGDEQSERRSRRKRRTPRRD